MQAMQEKLGPGWKSRRRTWIIDLVSYLGSPGEPHAQSNSHSSLSQREVHIKRVCKHFSPNIVMCDTKQKVIVFFVVAFILEFIAEGLAPVKLIYETMLMMGGDRG